MSLSLLFVAYSYPPDANAGAHRPATMAKYLRRFGHDVTVLTTRAYGALPDDAKQGIERAYDLQLARARLSGRARLEPIFEAGTYTNRPHPLSYVIPPEPSVVAWAPFAAAKGVRLHRRRRFDCVLSTSPLESVHVVGYALQRLGVPWIADLRDGWIFESLRPRWPLRAQQRLDEWIERRALRAADGVVAVHRALVDDFERRLGIQASYIPNGWDPDLAAASEPHLEGARSLLDSSRVSLMHAGRLAASDRDPTPVVRALSELAVEDPPSAERLELVIAGPTTQEEVALFRTDVAPARIVLAGSLTRAEVIALQRSAGALLLITAGTRTFEAPGKLFEYLAAGKPILALARNNEAARILEETGGGINCPPGDAAAVKRALLELLAGRVPPASPTVAERYAYPNVARSLEEVIDRVRADCEE